MDKQHLTSFKVENFKRFNTLEVEDIKQFNLIVGDNNVGKTSFLESLLLSEDIKETLCNLLLALGWRNFQFKNVKVNVLESYFNKQDAEIRYTLKYINQTRKINISVVETTKLTKEEQDELNLKNIGKTPFPYSFILTHENSTIKEIEFSDEENNSKVYAPFIKYNFAYGVDLLEFYSTIIQQSKTVKQELINNLSLLIPNIENIEISAGDSITPRFIVTLKNIDKPQYINQFGDGSIKFLRYLLEISFTNGKRLMIDEIDTGIHYSRMKDFWKILLRVAKNNDVQIFATTHSKECIQYYKEALNELKYEENSRIIKLKEHNDKSVKAYTYSFNEFEHSLDFENEIR